MNEPIHDALRPDYPTEQAAHAAGWRLVTSAFLLPPERELAVLVLSGFRGERPGHRAVQVAIVGDRHRVSFARPARDLIGFDTEPEATTPPAPRVEPMADAA